RASAPLFDVGIFLFHNTDTLIRGGAAPLFYLPKIEHFLEARLWNEILEYSERLMGVPAGTFRVSVLIETLTAALQMEEILHEMKSRITALNCGRWDYLFSFLKCHAHRREVLLPDRDQLHMGQVTMLACAELLIDTCHRRGALAIGGMAAQIPNRHDPKAHAAALAAVTADKRREVLQGFDGTWVAHPGLVRTARDAFQVDCRNGPTGLYGYRDRPEALAQRLLSIPCGSVSAQGVRESVRIALLYLESWFRGEGCVVMRGRMEDAATAEICRAHLWHLQHCNATMSGGEVVSPQYLENVIEKELIELVSKDQIPENAGSSWKDAKETLLRLVLADECEEFFTVKAYERL
ncbi:MAG: malate synthase A, partial [Myxococcota bacterium]